MRRDNGLGWHHERYGSGCTGFLAQWMEATSYKLGFPDDYCCRHVQLVDRPCLDRDFGRRVAFCLIIQSVRKESHLTTAIHGFASAPP
jgi:hypothetical protein